MSQSNSISKKAKIIIGVSVWLVLLGTAAGLAFLLRPKPEEIHLGSIVEEYEYVKVDDTGVTDTVDDLDYYGFYTSNALKFIPLTSSNNYQDPLYNKIGISGLKDKAIEQKINNRIVDAINSTTNEVRTTESSSQANMFISANYFNVLSIYLSYYYPVKSSDGPRTTTRVKYVPLTFDLNTGNELAFNDLFSENVNLRGILYNGFYNKFSTDLKFSRLSIERTLAMESTFPNPQDCQAMYCPGAGETYDDLRARRAEIDAKLADLEAYTYQAIDEYLSGDRKFYLASSGPVFILSDGTAVDLKLKENIRYAVYLKHYRSDSSLFEDNSLANKNQFFTEMSDAYSKFINIETNNYLIDAMVHESDRSTDQRIIDLAYDYAFKKGLSYQSDPAKFRHIVLDISAPYKSASYHLGNYLATINLRVRELDKSYYDSTYKKAIIDGKSSSNGFYGNSVAHAASYDPTKVDSIVDNIATTYILINDKGEIFDSPETILKDADDAPSSFPTSWKEYFKNYFYNYFCTPTYSWQTKRCFSDEEKINHEFEYELGFDAIYVELKNIKMPGGNGSYRASIDLRNIPYGYINPSLRNM